MTGSDRDEIAKLQALYSANPEGRIFTHLAEAYRRVGDLGAARELVERGLKRHGGYSSAHVVLGRILLDQGEVDAASTAFQRVLSIDPENRVALRTLADLARDAGRYAEAADYYREVLLLDPGDEEADALLRSLDITPASTSDDYPLELADETALSIDDWSGGTEPLGLDIDPEPLDLDFAPKPLGLETTPEPIDLDIAPEPLGLETTPEPGDIGEIPQLVDLEAGPELLDLDAISTIDSSPAPEPLGLEVPPEASGLEIEVEPLDLEVFDLGGPGLGGADLGAESSSDTDFDEVAEPSDKESGAEWGELEPLDLTWPDSEVESVEGKAPLLNDDLSMEGGGEGEALLADEILLEDDISLEDEDLEDEDLFEDDDLEDDDLEDDDLEDEELEDEELEDEIMLEGNISLEGETPLGGLPFLADLPILEDSSEAEPLPILEDFSEPEPLPELPAAAEAPVMDREFSPMDREAPLTIEEFSPLVRGGAAEDPAADDLLFPEEGGYDIGLVVTETMADLYASQGLLSQAAEVYQELLNKYPDAEGLRKKLADLGYGVADGALSSDGSPADRSDGMSEIEVGDLSVGESSAFVGGDLSPRSDEARGAVSHPVQGTGRAIGDYLVGLLAFGHGKKVESAELPGDLAEELSGVGSEGGILHLDESMVVAEAGAQQAPPEVPAPEPEIVLARESTPIGAGPVLLDESMVVHEEPAEEGESNVVEATPADEPAVASVSHSEPAATKELELGEELDEEEDLEVFRTWLRNLKR